ncbi:MAG: cyclic nucleotide-binding domain-containing protein, partial [Egibacteraceae bacterium]
GLTRRRYHLEPGSLVGELAFFDGKPRSADVVATSDGELVSLSRERCMGRRQPVQPSASNATASVRSTSSGAPGTS